MELTCAFTGHRYMSLPYGSSYERPSAIYIKNLVKRNIETLYLEYGVSTFLSGMAIGVDQLCAEAVLEMRRSYPDIRLNCILPCRNQSDRWSSSDRKKYRLILRCANRIVCLREHYTEGCMLERNKYLVNNSDILLAVWNGTNGGTAHTYRYARSWKKPIIRIDPLKLTIDRTDFSDVLFRN